LAVGFLQRNMIFLPIGSTGPHIVITQVGVVCHVLLSILGMWDISGEERSDPGSKLSTLILASAVVTE
jgi:hypothetical protein